MSIQHPFSLQGQRALASSLLLRHLRTRVPGGDFYFHIAGQGKVAKSFKQRYHHDVIKITGLTQFVDNAAADKLFHGKAALLQRRTYAELQVNLPDNLPSNVVALHRLYQQQFNTIVSDGRDIAQNLKLLFEQVMRQAVLIALDKQIKVGKDFCLLLAAGSSRGPNFDSDLDYILVYRNESKDVLSALTDRIDEILWQIGIKPDNLALRFTGGRQKIIHIDKLAKYDALVQQIKTGIIIEDVGKHELAEQAKATTARSTSQQTSIDLDMFWCTFLRESSDKNCLVHPGVEMRKYHYYIRQGDKCDEIERARDFFEKLKNFVWLLHRGSLSYITNCNLAEISLLMGFQCASDFQEKSFKYKAVIDNAYRKSIKKQKGIWLRYLLFFAVKMIQLQISKLIKRLYCCYINVIIIPKIYNPTTSRPTDIW